MAEVLQNRNDDLQTAVADWQEMGNGLHYTWLLDYATYTAGGTYSLSESQWAERELVTNFKGNTELTTDKDHEEAVQQAIKLVSDKITSTFGTLSSQLTLVCIPASTEAATRRRFEAFSEAVCENCSMENGCKHIIHQADNSLVFDAAYFESRPILIVDDIIASGASVRHFVQKAQDVGVVVIAALVLAKKAEDTYDHER